MPIWVAALVGGLLQAASSFVGRVLLALGIGFVAYTGIDVVLSGLQSQVVANFGGLPAVAIGILAVTKIDVALNIIFSAIAARMVLKGLTSGTMKRMVIK